MNMSERFLLLNLQSLPFLAESVFRLFLEFAV